MLIGYLLRRAAGLLFVLWFVITLLFFLLRASGDPVLLLAGPSATQQDVEELRRAMKLDDPVIVQYVTYLGDVARLDFGRSFISNRPAMDTVRERLPKTLQLSLIAFAIALTLGGVVGVVSALKRNSWLSTLLTGLVTFVQGIPSFALAIFLITFFAVRLGWLPSFGDDSWKSLVLPSVTLAAYLGARTARLVRSSLVEVLEQDYIRTARSKGLTPRAITVGHALKNAMIPVVTVLAIDLGHLLGGAVVTETVFAWPGIGRQLVLSISQRDYAVVQAIVFVIAAGVVVINLTADLVYAKLDPRIKL
jgi:peptide/nickel transport system permease protein